MNASEVCEALGIGITELVGLLALGDLRISEESVEEYIARRLPARAS